ncbi:transposase [Tundrisphaera lichenicola]|uniref:transposase n=1 Tax=Tundrisphaera lichenicola TaxID=2029860 RepID=UPI003EBA6DFA
MDSREKKGQQIASCCRIKKDKDGYSVPSQMGKGRYEVTLEPYPRCTCPDYELHANKCKHIYAVEYSIRCEVKVESDGQGNVTKTERVTVTATKRTTYKQDWPAYNAAQTGEKDRFQELLAELCRGVTEPPAPPKGGRPSVPLSDRVFSVAFKVYSTLSSRRFACDLKAAHEKGHIYRLPHFNSVLRFLEDGEMTPILKAMIAESGRPLASIEQDFAADSSGFTTSRFESWYDHKYGVIRRQHEWVKVHVMCGVKTNVVTAVEIRDKDAQDAPLLPALMDSTADRFTMREVSADKVYASLKNYAEIAKHGATPYIPFKSNHTGRGGGLWAKMYHYFNYNRDEFLTHYHKRSNVESVFSMIKAKFGDAVRSKTDVAMRNEALCKVLCHNVCCLIQSTHELGIEAKFWLGEPAIRTRTLGESSDEDLEAWGWV